jgi:hypothetical protein
MEPGQGEGGDQPTPHQPWQHEPPDYLFSCGYQLYTLKMDDCEDGREIVHTLSPFPEPRSKCARYIKFIKWKSETPVGAEVQVRYDKGRRFERLLHKLHPNIRIVHVDYTY